MNLKELNGLPFPERAIPVRGYLVSETADEIWLQDGQGTWVFAVKDVVGRSVWEAADPRFQGKPTLLFIRDEATFYELKRYRVEMRARPITLPPHGSKSLASVGNPEGSPARGMEEAWLRHVGFRAADSSGGSTEYPPRTFCESGGEYPGVDDCGW